MSGRFRHPFSGTGNLVFLFRQLTLQNACENIRYAASGPERGSFCTRTRM